MVASPGALQLDESLFFYSKDVRLRLVEPFPISLDSLHQLRLPTEAPFSMEAKYIMTNEATMRSRDHHVSHDTHRVVSLLLAKHIASGAGLAPRAETAVGSVGQHQTHVLVQSRAQI